EDWLRVDPAQEVLGRLLVLRIGHHHAGERRRVDELAGGTLRQSCMEDVVLDRLALLGLVRVGLALGLDIDRGAVVGRADGAGEKGAVVARIVPGKPALVAAFLPEGNRVLDRLDRLLAVQRDSLAVGGDLLTAERPQERVPERGGIAESVASGLAEGMAGGFELLPSGAVVVPGLRELVLGIAGLGEP